MTEPLTNEHKLLAVTIVALALALFGCITIGGIVAYHTSKYPAYFDLPPCVTSKGVKP